MKHPPLGLLALLLAVACTPAAEAPEATGAADALPETGGPADAPAPPPPVAAPGLDRMAEFPRLEDLVRPDDTLTSLQARLGADVAIAQVLPGSEGESSPGWVLYPEQPARRLEVFLDEDSGLAQSLVARQGATAWVRADGVRIGLALPELVALNGRSLVLTGFGWDYGGTVVDWNGGAIAPDGRQAGFVRLCAPESSASLDSSRYPTGEAGVDSGLPVLQEHPPSVCEFTLTVAPPP